MSAAPPPKVLIVDDDPGLLRLVERALKREKFATATAESGHAAIDWIGANSADLLLLDLKLQDMEGQEVIGRLRESGKILPFIIITGQGDERVAVEMMRGGALDYLVKDVRFIEFVPTVVRRALNQIDKDKRLAMAELRQELQHDTARVLAEAASLTEATDKILRAICQSFGWEFGELWRVDPTENLLRNVSTWPVAGARETPWAKFTSQLTLAPGADIAGRAWTTRQPAYIPDIMRDHSSPRKELARELGLSSAFAFPVQLGGNVLAVMTFFGKTVPAPDADLLDFFVSLGRQIGQFIDRKQLERQVLEISDWEQHRIGHDLHDGLGQQLTALELFSVSLTEELRDQAPDLVEPVKKMSEQLREAIRHTRAMASGLSPVALQGDGLRSALRKLTEGASMMAKVDCVFVCDAGVNIHDTATATHLYRIAQEAVNNALKHGRAKHIRVSLTQQNGLLELIVSDDGQGFSPESARGGGMGLRVMNYRADLIGASFRIESAQRKGARVTCSIRQAV